MTKQGEYFIILKYLTEERERVFKIWKNVNLVYPSYIIWRFTKFPAAAFRQINQITTDIHLQTFIIIYNRQHPFIHNTIIIHNTIMQSDEEWMNQSITADIHFLFSLAHVLIISSISASASITFIKF